MPSEMNSWSAGLSTSLLHSPYLIAAGCDENVETTSTAGYRVSRPEKLWVGASHAVCTDSIGIRTNTCESNDVHRTWQLCAGKMLSRYAKLKSLNIL